MLRWTRKKKKKKQTRLFRHHQWWCHEEARQKVYKRRNTFWYTPKGCRLSGSRGSSWRVGSLYHSDDLCRKGKTKIIWYGHVLKKGIWIKLKAYFERKLPRIVKRRKTVEGTMKTIQWDHDSASEHTHTLKIRISWRLNTCRKTTQMRK